MASDEWRGEIEEEAGRELRRLPSRSLMQEAVEVIDDLAADPFPAGGVKLQKHRDAYRVRFGGNAYRIVYRVIKKQRLVRVFAVGRRPAVYRGIRG